MITVDEIIALKKYYVETLYASVRSEQRIDETYRKDTFAVPEIKPPHQVFRAGRAARIVDSAAEQIITSNPQAIFKIHKGYQSLAGALSREVNGSWLTALKRQNPNAFKEFVKNLLIRGEAYIQITHNDYWRETNSPPIQYSIPDPMTVYASPEHDHNGIPERIIVSCVRQASTIKALYPNWSNPARAGTPTNWNTDVQWLAYWDKDFRFFSADGEPVLQGAVQENVYSFVPFVHKLSGFGRKSPEGKLEDLIVSDIRMTRDLIREECAVRSEIVSNLHLFVHPRIDLLVPDTATVSAEQIEKNYDMSAGSFNVVTMPPGGELREGLRILVPEQVFNHLYQIIAEVEKRHPFLSAGMAFGSSGRQQDMSWTNAMRRYDTVIENTENAFATAIEKGLQLCRDLPDMKPEILTSIPSPEDMSCSVTLKAKDPVEHDRLVTLGDRLWNQGNGSIDLRTNLIEFQGRTQEQTEEIIANILVDKLTLYNPDVASVMGMVFAEESGLEKWIEQAQQQRLQYEQEQAGLAKQAPRTTTERVKGEASTPLGMEMIDMALTNRGARQPPAPYERNK